MRMTILSIFLVSTALGNQPRIFFSDLESGPKTGAQNNAGAFVTIYGNNFGSNPRVTIGGGEAIIQVPPTSYLWYQKLVIQLGPNVVSGNIVVTTGVGASNGVPFTVRGGNIHFVATTGDDAKAGDFTHPWASLQHAVDSMAPGDITYAMDGVTQTRQSYDGSLVVNASGAPGAPLALVAYPGATVKVGNGGSGNCAVGQDCWEGLYNGGALPQPSYWVFAGMKMAGQDRAIKINAEPSTLHDWRIVGNDFTCPWSGISEDACVVFADSSHIQYFGNSMHDVANLTPDSIRQAESMGVYFTTDCNYVEIGWSSFWNVAARGGIQIHSTPYDDDINNIHLGFNLHDISIHDNLLHDGYSDGIIIATVSPELGPVTLYNNVIYNWGTGPLPQNGGSFSCIYVVGGSYDSRGFGRTDTNGTVPVQLYNNTLYNCATGTPPPGVGFIPAAIALGSYSPLLKANLQNNIIYNTGKVQYTVDYNQVFPSNGIPVVNLVGNNDLFFGSTAPLPAAGFSALSSRNPLFTNIAVYDFHPRPGSPAIGAGVIITALATDVDGMPRTSPPDIGAYQRGVERAIRPRGEPGMLAVSVAPTVSSLRQDHSSNGCRVGMPPPSDEGPTGCLAPCVRAKPTLTTLEPLRIRPWTDVALRPSLWHELRVPRERY